MTGETVKSLVAYCRPELELYRVEVSLNKILSDIATEIGLDRHPDFAKRIDLLLANGDQLTLLEFMRPGVTINRDHINRFTEYADELRARIGVNTAGRFRRLTGIIVADRLDKSRGGNQEAISRLQTCPFRKPYPGRIRWIYGIGACSRAMVAILCALLQRHQNPPVT